MPDKALLLYTRRYLARNHLLAPQPGTYCRLPPISPITDIRDPFTFSPCDDLDVLAPPVLDLSEKLILKHDIAIYLSSIFTAPDEEGGVLFDDLRWSKSRRIEEPLVVEKRKKKIHRVKEEILSAAPLGIGGDAGITWDRNTRRQIWDYVRGVEAEKMIIGPKTLQFLQDVHRPRTPPSTVEVIKEEMSYCKPATSEYMTPPLLPSSPATLPLPLNLAGTFDLKPLDAGKTSALISDLTASFVAADSMFTDPSPDSYLSFLQLLPPTPSPIRKRPRPESLMVEALLTPPTPTTKRVRFADSELPPRISTPECEGVGSELEEKRILIRVDQELAQEQLQEADSTLRIEVPVMDFSRPKPPWEGLEKGLRRLRELKGSLGPTARNWGGSGSFGMDLLWRPFVRSSIKVPIEDLKDDELIKELVVNVGEGDEEEGALTEGLRTMGLEGIEKDDMELEPGTFSVKMDIETLVMRKKQKRSKLIGQAQTTVEKGGRLISKKESRLWRDAGTLPKTPLDTFMALRSRVAKNPAKALSSRTIQINPEIEAIPKPTVSRELAVTPAPPPFPVPKIRLPASPGTFIVSTTLLAERRLFKQIKDLYPTAVIIERDFSAPIPDAFAGISSIQNCANIEADLLLSPLSGIVLTTLQKIRQAPLPGHALSTIRQRVADVALLYERLFVIILGNVRGNDGEIVAGFIAFAAALRAGVHVRILDDDKDVTARWVVSFMVREGSAARLLEEETLWERFLRKAGFNAFAAQVVLRECREGGLRGFLKMETREKRKCFKEVVGENVLERVLWRLGGEWDV